MIKKLLILIVLLFINFTFMNAQDSKEPVQNYQAELEYQSEAKLGEGAFWDYRTQQLYWIDILDNSLHIYNPKTKKNRSLSTASTIGTVVPSKKENEAVIALQDGVYLINTKSGKTRMFSNVEKDVPSNRLNDGKCDPSGRLWVGSMAFNQEKGAAKLYMIDEKGEAVIKKDKVTISNGIVWSKNNKTMFYIDTPTSEIKAYRYNDSAGTISNERVLVKIDDSLGSPDGMTIDENDNLWVGMWNGNAVLQFDSKTGKLLAKVNVPAHNVTSCAFGGENLDELYITTASIDMSDEEKEKFPLAGSLYKVKTEVKGVKGHLFKGL